MTDRSQAHSYIPNGGGDEMMQRDGLIVRQQVVLPLEL
jgi:hypothetical protein